MSGLQVRLSATYLVDIPQKDIDMVKRCTTNVSDEEIAGDLAKISVVSNQETPLDFEVVEIKEEK